MPLRQMALLTRKLRIFILLAAVCKFVRNLLGGFECFGSAQSGGIVCDLVLADPVMSRYRVRLESKVPRLVLGVLLGVDGVKAGWV